jgi:hypothetical protein
VIYIGPRSVTPSPWALAFEIVYLFKTSKPISNVSERPVLNVIKYRAGDALTGVTAAHQNFIVVGDAPSLRGYEDTHFYV